MKSLVLRFFILSVLLLVPMTFNSCSAQFKTEDESGTLVGNPEMQMSTAAFDSSSPVTSLMICLSGLELKSALTLQNEELVLQPALYKITSAGVSLGSTFVPPGSYDQATLKLSDQCGTTSLQFDKGGQTFTSTEAISLSFNGRIESSQRQVRAQFNVNSLIDALENIAAASDVKAVSESSGGSVTMIGPTASDQWTPLSLISAPSAREGHTAVWTGQKMFVWGGTDNQSDLQNGALFDPVADTWRMISSMGVPDPRSLHQAVWTGTEVLIWGGISLAGYSLDTGGRYNPSTDIWNSTSMAGAPEDRTGHTMIWTGLEAIVWGGRKSGLFFDNGFRYNPATNTWTPVNLTGAPQGRSNHISLWTGTEMLIWGGATDTSGTLASSGGLYDPASNSWRAITSAGAPTPREKPCAVWTGTTALIWGAGSPGNDGGIYNPQTDTWLPISNINAPAARTGHTCVWTGTEMIVWDGLNSSPGSGGRYNPSTDTWTTVSQAFAPNARANHSAIWTGSEMLIWGGSLSNIYFRSGGRYRP
jgi:hypothetical protein